MYDIACSFSLGAGTTQSSITVSGLSENMGKAIDLVEQLIAGALPDEAILANLKADMIKRRADSKLNQQSNFSAMQRYVFYGPEFIRRTTLDNPSLEALTSPELLSKVRELMGKQHEVLYYGPMSEKEFTATLAEHHKTAAELQPLEKIYSTPQPTDRAKVVLAQYDAKQLYYLQYSNRGELFDVKTDPEINLYNEYFSGGMNSICFQEMREARGLAYSAYAMLSKPGNLKSPYMF